MNFENIKPESKKEKSKFWQNFIISAFLTFGGGVLLEKKINNHQEIKNIIPVSYVNIKAQDYLEFNNNAMARKLIDMMVSVDDLRNDWKLKMWLIGAKKWTDKYSKHPELFFQENEKNPISADLRLAETYEIYKFFHDRIPEKENMILESYYFLLVKLRTELAQRQKN